MEGKINDLLDIKFAEEEFADCFLVELKLHANNKLEVFIDSDTGITFDRCRRISRYLEAYLDENVWQGQKYTLDVSSPGVTRPLKFQRQYPKHIGRKLKVKLQEGEDLEGLLKEVHPDHITLEQKIVEKEGKKKKHLKIDKEVPFSEIEGALVQISFK